MLVVNRHARASLEDVIMDAWTQRAIAGLEQGLNPPAAEPSMPTAATPGFLVPSYLPALAAMRDSSMNAYLPICPAALLPPSPVPAPLQRAQEPQQDLLMIPTQAQLQQAARANAYAPSLRQTLKAARELQAFLMSASSVPSQPSFDNIEELLATSPPLLQRAQALAESFSAAVRVSASPSFSPSPPTFAMGCASLLPSSPTTSPGSRKHDRDKVPAADMGCVRPLKRSNGLPPADSAHCTFP